MEESDSTEPVEDNEGYLHLWRLSKKENNARFNELCDRYISDGENEEDASDMANNRVRPYEEKNFLCRYGTLLENYWLPLKSNAVHQEILREIEVLTEKSVALTSAVKRVLRKYKPQFEDLFDFSEIEDDSDDEDDSVDESEDADKIARI